MYAYILQATEGGLWRRWGKTPTVEANPSPSNPTATIDDLPASTLAFAPSSFSTMSSSSSFILPTVSITSDEMPFLNMPQNPSLIATTTFSPLFPILPEISQAVSPIEPITAPSPPTYFADLDIPSTSNNTHSPPPFTFALNIPTGDDIPSPIMSRSSPPSPASVS